MVKLVGVHGICNLSYFLRAENDSGMAAARIGKDWKEWLAEGFGRHDPAATGLTDFPVAYYSDCLSRGVPMGELSPEGLEPAAQEVFVSLVERIRRYEEPIPDGLVAAGGPITRLLLRRSAEFLVRRHGRKMLGVVTALSAEIATYFGEAHRPRRLAARERVAEAVRKHRPRVLVAHSLGSVVAWEALSADPSLTVDLLVTMGSPLAVPTVVFDRLEPVRTGRRPMPPGVGSWVNIADRADFVAVPMEGLGGCFDGVEHVETRIHRFDPHTVKNYLRCAALAKRIAPRLV